MKTTAIVVDTYEVARALNKILPEGCKAYAVGQPRIGQRFDQIIVSATMIQDHFSEWFDTFRCCLAPGGEIIYD